MDAIRTSLSLAAIGGTIALALAVHGREAPVPEVAAVHTDDVTDDGMKLTAQMTGAVIGATEQDILVEIKPIGGAAAKRPPLSLAVVIDRSGSMNGRPIENAKRAAMKVLEQLDAADSFTLVTFSSAAQTVVPMRRATPDNIAAARAAIAQIFDDGGTCISCGLTQAVNELSMTPVRDGLRRMVMMSDGQANEGVYDRAELARMTSDIAAKGVSVSTVGVGLDFDEVTMTNLATVGRGNYYFVEDTGNLDAMFQRELGGLSETVAMDARLTIEPGPNVKLVEAYGYPTVHVGMGMLEVPIADLRAGETRKIVVHALVGPNAGMIDVARVKLAWRRVADSSLRNASATARAEVSSDATKIASSVNADVLRATESAQQARAIEQATKAYEEQGYAAAQRIMQDRARAMQAKSGALGNSWVEIQTAEGDTMIKAMPSAPAKAKKVARTKAYDMLH